MIAKRHLHVIETYNIPDEMVAEAKAVGLPLDLLVRKFANDYLEDDCQTILDSIEFNNEIIEIDVVLD